MNGPEHYREGERLLDEARGTNPQITYAKDATQLAAAQVHATLALAAATVTRFAPTDAAAWNEVTR